MYKKENLIQSGLPVLNPEEFRKLRANIVIRDIQNFDIESFKKGITNHFISNKSNTLKGFDAFSHQDIILGCQHFIDNLISKNGLKSLQILEHDYHYYKKLDPNISFANVETLERGKPLLIALPYPGHLAPHRQMKDILEICNDKLIDVHIDCAWLTSAFDVEFDFDQPCVKSFAMSFSKAYGLHWNKIGIRWSRTKDLNDAITIQNDSNGISRFNMYVAQEYMRHFPIDHLCQKYKTKYFDVCSTLKLRPSNIIHACFSIDRSRLYGLKNFFE